MGESADFEMQTLENSKREQIFWASVLLPSLYRLLMWP